jgi:hypothetical protein
MEETLPNKGILKNMIRKMKSLAIYTTVKKAETLNKP